MQTRFMNTFSKTNTFIILIVALFGSGKDSQAEFNTGDRPNWTLWRTGTACPGACPAEEANTSATVYVDTLADATGNVSIRVIPFADLSDNSDGV